MILEFPLQLSQLVSQFLYALSAFHEVDKCPNDFNAHPYGLATVQHVGCHYCSILCECVGQSLNIRFTRFHDAYRNLDQTSEIRLFSCKLKHEIFREPICIAFDCLIQVDVFPRRKFLLNLDQ